MRKKNSPGNIPENNENGLVENWNVFLSSFLDLSALRFSMRFSFCFSTISHWFIKLSISSNFISSGRFIFDNCLSSFAPALSLLLSTNKERKQHLKSRFKSNRLVSVDEINILKLTKFRLVHSQLAIFQGQVQLKVNWNTRLHIFFSQYFQLLSTQCANILSSNMRHWVCKVDKIFNWEIDLKCHSINLPIATVWSW